MLNLSQKALKAAGSNLLTNQDTDEQLAKLDLKKVGRLPTP